MSVRMNISAPPTSSYAEWLAGSAASLNTLQQRTQFYTSRLDDWGTFDQPAHLLGSWLNEFGGWTRYTYYHHLQSIYAWLLDTGQLERDPMARFKRPRRPRPNASPLTDTELHDVLSNTVDDLHAWMMLGYLAGLRTHEIAKFRGEDITPDSIHVIGKGGYEAWLPTHPDLWSLAQKYPREGHWFPSPQRHRAFVSNSWVGNSIRAAFRDNGITAGAGHRLRHTFATHLMRNGVAAPILQQMMRHSSLETTQAYIGVNAADMAAAVRTLNVHGLSSSATSPYGDGSGGHVCACPCGRDIAA